MNRRSRRHPDDIERIQSEAQWSGYTRGPRGVLRFGSLHRRRGELWAICCFALLAGLMFVTVLIALQWLFGS